jgi:hypothetical protein
LLPEKPSACWKCSTAEIKYNHYASKRVYLKVWKKSFWPTMTTIRLCVDRSVKTIPKFSCLMGTTMHCSTALPRIYLLVIPFKVSAMESTSERTIKRPFSGIGVWL